MKNIRKIGVILCLLILFGFSYGQNNFKGKTLEIKVNKTVALADGTDKINIKYRIEDDNGVPAHGINKDDITLLINGVKSDEFVLRSNVGQDVEITLIYKGITSKKDVKFIKETRELAISLSKTKILANGIDETSIKITDEDGNDWKERIFIYIDGEEIFNNTFKTKKLGKYIVTAKSGKFESNKVEVEAYEKISDLNLKSNKTNLLANETDKIVFTLTGKDQNGVPREIKDFSLVNSKGKVVSKSNILTSKYEGKYKVRVKYRGEYSNYINYTSISQKELKVLSHYPIDYGVNVDTDIEIGLNIELKDYNNGVEVLLDGTPILGSVKYDNKTKKISFVPTEPLEIGKKYQVRLNKSIMGINENRLNKDFSFEFNIVAREKVETVKVEKGEFILGDKSGKLWEFSSPTQEAFIKYDYLIGKTEITFDMYDQYTKDMRLPLVDDNGWGRGKHPIINVSWYEATEFLNWLSKEENLPPAYDENGNLIDENGNKTRDITKVLGYRLPTEIEWEFAGYGGNKSNSTLFSGSKDVNSVAWYSENSDRKTHEVAKKLPNELGIYDMSGNVWEWVNDNSSFYSGIERINSVGPKKGDSKILRGGSFNSIVSDSQLTFRGELAPATKDIYYGFRLAKTIIGGENGR